VRVACFRVRLVLAHIRLSSFSWLRTLYTRLVWFTFAVSGCLLRLHLYALVRWLFAASVARCGRSWYVTAVHSFTVVPHNRWLHAWFPVPVTRIYSLAHGSLPRVYAQFRLHTPVPSWLQVCCYTVYRVYAFLYPAVYTLLRCLVLYSSAVARAGWLRVRRLVAFLRSLLAFYPLRWVGPRYTTTSVRCALVYHWFTEEEEGLPAPHSVLHCALRHLPLRNHYPSPEIMEDIILNRFSD